MILISRGFKRGELYVNKISYQPPLPSCPRVLSCVGPGLGGPGLALSVFEALAVWAEVEGRAEATLRQVVVAPLLHEEWVGGKVK